MDCTGNLKMSLKIKFYWSGKNPFPRGELLKKDILWKFLNNGRDPRDILKGNELYRAIEKFTWFDYRQQEILYRDFDRNALRKFTQYLKKQENK